LKTLKKNYDPEFKTIILSSETTIITFYKPMKTY
jgi:hypothetical protein